MWHNVGLLWITHPVHPFPTPMCDTTHPMQHQPPHTATLPLSHSIEYNIYIYKVCRLRTGNPVSTQSVPSNLWLRGYISHRIGVWVGVWVPRGLPMPLPKFNSL